MVQKISQLKKSARHNLRGHYGTIIAAIFVSLLVMLLLNLPFRSLLIQGLRRWSAPRITVGVMGILIIYMVMLLFNAGMVWIHLNLAKGEEAVFRDVLHPFTNQPGKFIGCNLLRLFTGFLCLQPALLCLMLSVDVTLPNFFYTIERPLVWYACNWAMLAGIIAYFAIMSSWSLATCLLLEHPEMRVLQAIHRSRQLLKGGNRRRRFLLFLSFLGWLILGGLSFGIALLWILPYLRQSRICFFLDLQSVEGSASHLKSTNQQG